MNQKTPNVRKKAAGIPTWKAVMVIAVVLALLHVMIVFSIFSVSTASSGMTEIMRTYSGYIADSTDLLAGSSFLAEASMSFYLRPVDGEGNVNVGPLVGYANEYGSSRRGPDIQARFAGREIDAEIMQRIDAAAYSAVQLTQMQLHAFALILSVYPAPSVPAIAALPLPALSAEESAMTNEQRLDAAFEIISGTVYSDHKKVVSDNITAANAALQEKMQTLSAAQIKKVGRTRVLLWVATLSVIVVLLFAFALVIKLLVFPLRGFAHGINTGTALPEREGLAEVRLLAQSYNGLLVKKTTLENVLRAAAETDALTDLPNRYYMEHYMMQLEGAAVPAAFFLFDVNYLKRTNDEEGHLAGDALLKRAAQCILSCFKDDPEAKCFRYGGDEFAAIVKNCREEDIERITSRLKEAQKRFEVSMATGYAYAPDVSATSLREMLGEADRKMYEDKERIHSGDA